MARYRQTDEIVKLMNNPTIIRNTSIIAHVDHGKTTLSDSLLAHAGIISTQTAGQKLFLDSWDLEQKRQMTVFASNVSLVHTFNESRLPHQPHRHTWTHRLLRRSHQKPKSSRRSTRRSRRSRRTHDPNRNRPHASSTRTCQTNSIHQQS